MPSFLASVQSGCLFKTTLLKRPVNFLFYSFATVNQHSEGIKQDCVPIDNSSIVRPDTTSVSGGQLNDDTHFLNCTAQNQ